MTLCGHGPGRWRAPSSSNHHHHHHNQHHHPAYCAGICRRCRSSCQRPPTVCASSSWGWGCPWRRPSNQLQARNEEKSNKQLRCHRPSPQSKRLSLTFLHTRAFPRKAGDVDTHSNSHCSHPRISRGLERAPYPKVIVLVSVSAVLQDMSG